MIFSTRRATFISDCVFAVAATVTALNFETSLTADVRRVNEWNELGELAPVFMVYLMSYASLGIFWVGHHNFFHFTPRADTRTLWHNLHILFWITIMPFATMVLGKYPFMPVATTFYATVMVMVTVAFDIPRRYVVKNGLILESGAQPMNAAIKAMAKSWHLKAMIALALYSLAIPLSFIYLPATYGCFIIATGLYFSPKKIKGDRVAKMVYRKTVNGDD